MSILITCKKCKKNLPESEFFRFKVQEVGGKEKKYLMSLRYKNCSECRKTLPKSGKQSSSFILKNDGSLDKPVHCYKLIPENWNWKQQYPFYSQQTV